MAEEVIEKPGEPTESVQQTQEPKPEVPETSEELQGRLTVMEKERDSALQQAENAQGLIGQHTDELNQLRNDNAYFRQQGQQTQQGQVSGQQPVHPQNPATGSPAGSVDGFDPYDEDSVKRFNARQTEQQRALNEKFNQLAGYVQQTFTGSALSRARAFVQGNDAFKGVEEKTINMVSNLAQTGAVQPGMIEDPTTLYGCMDMIRGQQSRSDPNSQVTPVVVTPLDTPNPVRQGEPEQEINRGISKSITDMFYAGDEKKATEGARQGAMERSKQGEQK